MKKRIFKSKKNPFFSLLKDIFFDDTISLSHSLKRGLYEKKHSMDYSFNNISNNK